MFFNDDWEYDAKMWLKTMLCDVRINEPDRYYELQTFLNLFRRAIRSVGEVIRLGNFISINSLFSSDNGDGCNMWITVT